MSGRTRIALAAVVAALSLAVAAAPASAGVPDQQQMTVTATTAAAGSSSRAQTFTAGLSGGLDRVDLYLGGANAGPLTVEIRDVSLGAPGATVLASASVPPAAVVPLFAFVAVPFASPAPVLAGNEYAIVAYAGGADVYGLGAAEDVYAGGSLFASLTAPPTDWITFAAFDLAFKTYVVEDDAFELTGFSAPIDNTGLNIAKAGKTVPVKWRVTDSEGNAVDDPAHFESVTSFGDTCDSGPTDAIEDYAGGSGLQYLGDGNWQFNWQTPKSYAGHCRTLKLTLSDDSTLTANFKFTK